MDGPHLHRAAAGFPLAGLCHAVPRRRRMERHAADAGRRAIPAARRRSARRCRCSCAPSASARWSPRCRSPPLTPSPMSGCAGTRLQRRLTELCILIPFWISVLTRAFGWLALLSSRGLVNTWLQGAGLIDSPLQLARNEFGVILGMTHMLIPFAAFPLASAMRARRRTRAARRARARRLAAAHLLVGVPADDALGRDRRGADRVRVLARLLRHARHSRRRPQHHGRRTRLSANVPEPGLGARRRASASRSS